MAEEKKDAKKEADACECGCTCCGEKGKGACGHKGCHGACKAVIGFLLGILLTLGAVGLYAMGRCSARFGHGAYCPMMSAPAEK